MYKKTERQKTEKQTHGTQQLKQMQNNDKISTNNIKLNTEAT